MAEKPRSERTRMMTFPIPDHVILFGGSPLLLSVAKMLRERDISLDIFTAPRQEAEIVGEDGETLGEALTKAGMDWYVVTDDINGALPLHLITESTIGLGLGEAWSFGKPILDAFAGRLIDFMCVPLPEYRGGAHYSWAIMNEEMRWGSCLQEVTLNTVQGEVDDGAIILRKEYDVPHIAFIPNDWFRECGHRDLALIKEFFDRIKRGESFRHELIDETCSLFFPRLKTAEHGWIDWSWDGREIEAFINAFDHPYPGAQTTINGKAVNLRCVEFTDHCSFHPFTSGLIIRNLSVSLSIAVRGGTLVVGEVWQDGKIINDELKHGMRFFTSRERLERAMLYQANYTPAGDARAKEDHIIVGKKVSLRTLTLADCNARYLGWLNDPEVNKYLESRFQQQSTETLRSYVRSMEQSANDYLFAIEENESHQHIGNIKLGGINWHHRYCDVGYFIGQKGLWGKGLATEAIRLATEFAFKTLGLHHIRAGVYETNIGSIKALRKAGYAFDGIWNGQLLDGDRRTGHCWLSTTADAWQGVTA